MIQIVQAYAYGKYLGELNVSFDEIGEPLLLDKHVPEDEAILARLAVLAKPLMKSATKSRISAPINGDRKVCVQECEMGNLVALC